MDSTKIAVVGYWGSFPGADTPEELWKLCSKGEVGLSLSSEEDWLNHLPESFYKDENFRAIGGGPSHYKSFDAKFFGFSPKEAAYLDPQIRKSLETAWNAFEHAGYTPKGLQCSVGTYLASSVNSYIFENLKDVFDSADESQRSQILFLNEPDFLATRLAYQFGWRGPAFTIKCGCSSSTVAIHEACQALLNFDCDMALAGGVSIKSRYQYGYIFEKDSILSEDGGCCPFSSKAKGTVFANGIGMLVLKRLEEALSDGDTIHGVILATAINNDGDDKVGFMAPSVSGQKASMSDALNFAQLEPMDVNYIEAHGTATEIGDPIEFKGLLENFGSCQSHSIALGAVKGNVGHIDAASGVTGVIKVLEDLKHHSISPIANFGIPSEKISLSNSPFYVPTSVSRWKEGAKGRIAVVSSYGMGGTNAQVVLAESPIEKMKSTASGAYFFAVSAKTKEQLSERIAALGRYLEDHSDCELANVAYTLLIGKEGFSWRWSCIAESYDQLCEKIWESDKDVFQVESDGEIVLDSEGFSNTAALEKEWRAGKRFRLRVPGLKGFRRISLPPYPFKREEYWNYGRTGNQKIADPGKWFYLPYWKREQINPIAPDLNDKRIVIFGDSSILTEKLNASLLGYNAKIILVNSGDHFDQIGEEKYCIKPGDEQDMDALITQLEEVETFPDHILHLWNLGDVEKSFRETQDRGLYTIMALIKSCVKVKGKVPERVDIVCNGIANVSGLERCHPNKSTLIGLSQVLPKEYDGVRCHLLDVSLDADFDQNVKAILTEMEWDRCGEVALRGSRRFVKDYVPHRIERRPFSESLLSGKGNYLIVGGLGNFGMEFAEFLATKGEANIFLTSRSPFPPENEWDDWLADKGLEHTISRKIQAIRNITRNGSVLEVLKADVTKIEDLEAAKEHILKRHGPLSGVIHAAGVVENGMIQNKTVESLESVFAPKVCGTCNVFNVFHRADLDFLLLCSSMNSIIGGLGQLDNTAANAFIDAYAEKCASYGFDNVLAINWGAVNEARARNYATSPLFEALSQEHVKNKMTKEEIFDVYDRLFTSRLRPRMVVSTIDFNEVIKNWNRVGSLRELVKEVSLKERDRSQLALSKYERPENSMEIFIADLWQELLGIDRIGRNDNFFELGGNSLIAIQFIGRLTAHYPIKIHAMSIYEYPSLQSFAQYAGQLEKEYVEKVSYSGVGS